MHLSRSSDYALQAIIYLAGLPAGTVVSGSVISEGTQIPVPFLQKVLRLLVRSRLVRAQRGAGGGFQLALDPEQISMLRVIEAVDGSREWGCCTVDGAACERMGWCGVHQVVAEAEMNSYRLLKGTSIAHLQRESAARRDFLRAVRFPPAEQPRGSRSGRF